MSVNNCIEFHNNTIFGKFNYNEYASIEDDLISDRMRAKQQRASSADIEGSFDIVLVAINKISEAKTFSMLRPKKISLDISSELHNSQQNSSLMTADDSLDQSTELFFAKKRNSSLLTNLEFQKTSQGMFSTENSPKKQKNSREVQQKLLLGLSSLSGLVDKVQSKEVNFRFAHLKIFAQLNALKSQEKTPQKSISSPINSTDKKKAFYRQFFLVRKSTQEGDSNCGADKTHTLKMRA